MTKFIGRQKELDILRKCLDTANNNSGNLVLISGNSGNGKTALVHNFLQSTDNEVNIAAFTECNDKENLNPYAPIKDIIIQLNVDSSQKDKKTNREERRQKLKSFFSESGTKWISLIPIVGGYASVGIETIQSYKKTFKDQPISKIEGLEQVYEIFENELRRVAQNKTVIVFFDDIQWADSATLNFIFHLSKQIRKNPFKILLIASYRPDEIKIGRQKTNELGEIVNIRHPFADKLNELRNYTKSESHIDNTHNWLTEIAVNDLSKDETTLFLNTIFHKNNFKSTFFEQIYEITNGNPLFLNGISETLIQNKNIVIKNDVFELNHTDISNLPISVNAVIQEKIERLDEQLQKILSYASISGKSFVIQEIESILKIDEFELLDYLENLNKNHGLLTEEEGLFFDDLMLDIYSFSQKLVFHYVYDNIDNTKRRRLHKHIAATIKSIWKEKLQDNSEIYKKFNTHMQIAQGLIDGKTRLINIDIDKTNPEETYNNLIIAAKEEIRMAEESAKLWADNETLAHAENALAFISKTDQKNHDTEIIKYEAYYNIWHATYSQSRWEASKIIHKLAEITDYFESEKSDLLPKLKLRTAMCYTLHYDYKNAEKYFSKKDVPHTDREFTKEEDDLIEKYIQSGDYDKAYEIYQLAEIHEDNIDDEFTFLNIGIAALNHSSGLFLDKAEEILTKSYMFFDDECDHLMTTIASYHTGIVKYKFQKYKEAQFYLEKARIRYERWNWGLEYIDKILAEIKNKFNQNTVKS
ncbi:MAG: AAA family ATPase [Bacteroidales bacterium]|nr:AAA family ATPase [Bacteroidales bacterium]